MLKKKNNLYIIGAGGLGRELECWLSLSKSIMNKYSIKGYLDDDAKALNSFSSAYKIVGTIDNFIFKSEDFVLFAIADPITKEKISHRLNGKVRFFTFVAESSIISKNSLIGEGSVIAPNCVIAPNVSIGRFVTINLGANIGHDSSISDFTSIMASVNISGKVFLGKSVYIGSNATIAPGRKIGDLSKISLGSVVFNDLPEHSLVYGNPAKKISIELSGEY